MAGSCLPSELVRLVLELAEPPIEAGGIQPADIAYRALLRACCLVSRQWAAAAQPQLARKILVRTKADYDLVERAIAAGAVDIGRCAAISAERDVPASVNDSRFFLQVRASTALMPRLHALVQRATGLRLLRLADAEMLGGHLAPWSVRRVWAVAVAVTDRSLAHFGITNSPAIVEVSVDKWSVLPPHSVLAAVEGLEVGTRLAPISSLDGPVPVQGPSAGLRTLRIHSYYTILLDPVMRVRFPLLSRLVVGFMSVAQTSSEADDFLRSHYASAVGGKLRKLVAQVFDPSFAPSLRFLEVELSVASDWWSGRDDGGSMLATFAKSVTREAWHGMTEWVELDDACSARSVALTLEGVQMPWLESLF